MRERSQSCVCTIPYMPRICSVKYVRYTRVPHMHAAAAAAAFKICATRRIGEFPFKVNARAKHIPLSIPCYVFAGGFVLGLECLWICVLAKRVWMQFLSEDDDDRRPRRRRYG